MSLGATGEYAAVAGVHPSLFKEDEKYAHALRCPCALLPAKVRMNGSWVSAFY